MARAPQTHTDNSAHAPEMPAAVKALQPRKSMSEIAELLATNSMAMRGVSETPNEVEQDVEEDDTVDEGAPETVDVADGDDSAVESDADDDEEGAAVHDGDDSADSDPEAEVDEDEDEDDDGADDDAAPETLEIEYDDDDLVELGEDTVSLGDLKAAYMADKNSVKTAKAQAEALQEASRVRAKIVEDAQYAQGALNEVLRQITEAVLPANIAKPDPSLRSTNPQEYLRQLDIYEENVAHSESIQQNLTSAFDAYKQHAQDQIKKRQALAIQQLNHHLPALQSESTRKQAAQDILSAAKHFGFTDEEVNIAGDHRLYLMAYEAAQYRKIMANSSTDPEDVEERQAKKEKAKKKVRQTRTLRSRGTTAKNRLSNKAKQLRVLKQKAQASGRSEDVAAYLIAQQS